MEQHLILSGIVRDPGTVDDVVAAEGHYPSIRQSIMNSTPFHPLQIYIVQVLKVHHSEKEGPTMKLNQRLPGPCSENGQEQLSDIEIGRSLCLINKLGHIFQYHAVHQ